MEGGGRDENVRILTRRQWRRMKQFLPHLATGSDKCRHHAIGSMNAAVRCRSICGSGKWKEWWGGDQTELTEAGKEKRERQASWADGVKRPTPWCCVGVDRW